MTNTKASCGSIAVMKLSSTLPRGVGTKKPTPEELVRAGLEAAIEAANQDSLDGDISLGALQWVTDTIHALSDDPEAIAAIVTRVTEGK